MCFDSYCVINNYPILPPKRFVTQYMKLFGLRNKSLFEKWHNSGKPKKRIGDVNMSEVKKVICLYLKWEHDLNQYQINRLVGYVDRSSVSHSIKVATINYINKDQVFMRYWNRVFELNQCA